MILSFFLFQCDSEDDEGDDDKVSDFVYVTMIMFIVGWLESFDSARFVYSPVYHKIFETKNMMIRKILLSQNKVVI